MTHATKALETTNGWEKIRRINFHGWLNPPATPRTVNITHISKRNY